MSAQPTDVTVTAGRRRLRWPTAGAAFGGIAGLLPHLLHHVGLLAGAGLLAGLGGTLVFGLLGLAATTPLLLRLRRRFRTWWAPAAALAVFAALFAVSAFLVGPALRNATSDHPADHPAPSSPASDGHTGRPGHAGRHG